MTEDPFAILGLEARYSIDAGSVRRRLVTEAARLHPDRAPDPVTASAWSEELARMHEAARCVLDDLDRAESLLSLRGGPGPSEDRSLPEGFLESILAIRMELEDVIAAGDVNGREAIEAWGRDEWAARKDAVQRLLDGPRGETPETLTEVRRELNRWRYSQRMLEQLEHGSGVGER